MKVFSNMYFFDLFWFQNHVLHNFIPLCQYYKYMDYGDWILFHVILSQLLQIPVSFPEEPSEKWFNLKWKNLRLTEENSFHFRAKAIFGREINAFWKTYLFRKCTLSSTQNVVTNVVPTSQRSHNAAATSERHCYDLVCLLGNSILLQCESTI